MSEPAARSARPSRWGAAATSTAAERARQAFDQRSSQILSAASAGASSGAPAAEAHEPPKKRSRWDSPDAQKSLASSSGSRWGPADAPAPAASSSTATTAATPEHAADTVFRLGAQHVLTLRANPACGFLLDTSSQEHLAYREALDALQSAAAVAQHGAMALAGEAGRAAIGIAGSLPATTAGSRAARPQPKRPPPNMPELHAASGGFVNMGVGRVFIPPSVDQQMQRAAQVATPLPRAAAPTSPHRPVAHAAARTRDPPRARLTRGRLCATAI